MIKVERIGLILLISLLALTFFYSYGTRDVEAFTRWMGNIRDHGLRLGYELNGEDYPPLTSAILLGVTTAARLFQTEEFVAFKASLFLFLVLTGLAFYTWTRHFYLSAAVAAALLIGTMALSYVDAYFMPTLILAFWALQKRYWPLATLFFTTTCLIKWQPIILTPFVVLYVLSIHRLSDWRQINVARLLLQAGLPFALLIGLILLVFGRHPINAFQAAATDPFLSANALNFPWLVTAVVRTFDPNRFGPLVFGNVTFIASLEPNPFIQQWRYLFYLVYAVVLFLFWRREKSFYNLILFALLGYLAYAMFNTGVHENHLVLAILPAAILYYLDPPRLATFLTWALAANINLYAFYGIDGQGMPANRVVSGIDLSIPLAAFNVLAFLALLIFAIQDVKRER
jgi:hypothetical protein